MTTHKPVAPYYAVAITWLVYACFFPLYAPMHYVLMAVASGVVFFVTGLFCKSEPRTEEKTAGDNRKSGGGQDAQGWGACACGA